MNPGFNDGRNGEALWAFADRRRVLVTATWPHFADCRVDWVHCYTGGEYYPPVTA